MKINPNGFREYDARWVFEKDIDIEGITNLGKGLGTQIIQNTKIKNLEMSCFTGSYVTGTVNEEYLNWIESEYKS